MNQLLSRYYEEGFFIIPIRKNEKRPLYRNWNENPISYNEAKQFLKHGYNIGVVAKDLTILDYDNRPKPCEWYRNYGTLVQFTPRGHHVFYRGKDVKRLFEPNNFERVEWFPWEEPDTIRTGDMFVLLSPSKVNGHSYWWLDNMKGKIREV